MRARRLCSRSCAAGRGGLTYAEPGHRFEQVRIVVEWGLDVKSPMRKLKVDLGELMYVFDDASWETSHYLDLETG